MPAISKTAFLKPLRKNKEVYPLPEYGEGAYVVVQAMTSRDIVEIQTTHGGAPDSKSMDFVNDVFSRCLVDDAGNPIFDSAVEVGSTMNLSLPAMEDLLETCLRVSGIKSKRDEEKN